MKKEIKKVALILKFKTFMIQTIKKHQFFHINLKVLLKENKNTLKSITNIKLMIF